MAGRLKIVILGLSITSAWGNGHATTYRGLVKELCARGHEVIFLERDLPWYANNRDLPGSEHGCIFLYSSVGELKLRFEHQVRDADFVMVGSYVRDGIEVGEWVTSKAHGATAFYDLDTPVTLRRLENGDAEYISRALIPRYHLYLSFSGGPLLDRLERKYHSARALPLYCSVDPASYHPEAATQCWDLGFMGTYSRDRQDALNQLMLSTARSWPQGRMIVAGAQYPPDTGWPANVEHIEHVPPGEHRKFYNSQNFTLNLTRAEMIQIGYSPSVRLFEAAACATPIISDWWPGLAEFLVPDKEILIARSTAEVLRYLRELSPGERREIGTRARTRVLEAHTAARRAAELEAYVIAALGR